MATLLIGGYKFISRYQTLFCCLVVVWAIGIIAGSIFLAAWGNSKNSYDALPILEWNMRDRTVIELSNPKVLKAVKYCSPLLNGGREHLSEGKVKEKHELEAVVVVMRHGDRGPMQLFRNLNLIDCGLKVNQVTIYEDYLRFVENYGKRRSSRDAFRNFPLIPKNSTSCVPGHLTEWGFSQQLDTGTLLREIYVNKLGLLTNNWRPEQVVIVSTMMERTYQSAVSFAFAFLPNFDLTKLNIKIGLGATFCYSQQFCRCPLVDKLKPSVDSEKNSILHLHQAVQELVDRADSILRFQRIYSGNPARPDDVFDKLLVYACHGADLPCHRDNACITVDNLANLISFLEWRGKRLSELAKVKLLSRLSMQGFLTDLLKRLVDISTNKKKTRVIVYSAHDNTLMPLLLSLGVYDGVRPPYSSRLIFELHSFTNEQNVKSHYIKVIYNGKDITKRVQFCCKKSRRPKLDCRYCFLEYFSRFVEKDYLVELNATSFKQACSM